MTIYTMYIFQRSRLFFIYVIEKILFLFCSRCIVSSSVPTIIKKVEREEEKEKKKKEEDY